MPAEHLKLPLKIAAILNVLVFSNSHYLHIHVYKKIAVDSCWLIMTEGIAFMSYHSATWQVQTIQHILGWSRGNDIVTIWARNSFGISYIVRVWQYANITWEVSVLCTLNVRWLVIFCKIGIVHEKYKTLALCSWLHHIKWKWTTWQSVQIMVCVTDI